MVPPKKLATATRTPSTLAERTPAACLAWPTPCGAALCNSVLQGACSTLEQLF